jgi:hypothetical protein
VFLTWAGTASNNPIYIKHRECNFCTWTPPILVSGNFGLPTLLPISSQTMEMVYRGNNLHLFRLYTNDGVSFGQPIQDNATTSNFAAIPFMVFPGRSNVWAFYTGQNSQLYTVIE